MFRKGCSNDKGFPLLVVIRDLQFRGMQVNLSRHKFHAPHLCVQWWGQSEDRPTKLVVSQHWGPQPISQVHSHLVLETCRSKKKKHFQYSVSRLGLCRNYSFSITNSLFNQIFLDDINIKVRGEISGQ